jgi:hypothetical protein
MLLRSLSSAALLSFAIQTAPAFAQTIYGRVVDAETRASIPFAGVSLIAANGSAVTTAICRLYGSIPFASQSSRPLPRSRRAHRLYHREQPADRDQHA